MNKYQEALDKLVSGAQNDIAETTDRDEDYSQILEYKNLLQELVDKEKPMKPKTKKYRRGSEWVCPKCKEHIAYFDELGIGTVRDLKYCNECGQKLSLRSDK